MMRKGVQPCVLNTHSEGGKYILLFRCSLFCEYINLEYVRIHIIYRVHQTEYTILVAAPQEYVNTYSTRRGAGFSSQMIEFSP